MDRDFTTTKIKENKKLITRNKNVNNGFYAAVNPASYKISQIVNINAVNKNDDGQTSSGGLVFKYIDRGDKERSILEKRKTIFLKHYGYNLGDITLDEDLSFLVPTPLITIEEVDFTTLSSEHLKKIREMSLLFTELTFNQIFALDKFIRENFNNRKFISMHLTVGL